MEIRKKGYQIILRNAEFLNAPYFSYLKSETKKELENGIKNGTSQIFDFTLGFAAVFDFDSESVHINVVVGNYRKHKIEFEDFYTALAIVHNVRKITFCPGRKGAEKMAIQDGFRKNHEFGYYEKVI